MNAESLSHRARLACTLAASVAAGFESLDADAVFVGAACLIACGCRAWSWWKNNNVTKAAQDVQKVLDEIRKRGVTVAEEMEDQGMGQELKPTPL